MTRNTELHFSEMPTKIDIGRSKLKEPCRHLTTFNEGELIPIFHMDILPGDTIKIDQASLVRMATPIYPVMDNSWMDIYYFFVPNRLLWTHWVNFMGENTESYWTPEVEYTIPQTQAPEGGWKKGSLADHFGIRTNKDNFSVNSLPFRAYCKIYNDWFRSEVLCEPLNAPMDDSTVQGNNGTDEVTDCIKGGMPAKVGRLADYFSSCLPSCQRGPAVSIPLGNTAPIIGTDNVGTETLDSNLLNKELKMWRGTQGTTTPNFLQTSETSTNLEVGKAIGLAADLSSAGAATISQLRQAFAIQHMYERDGLFGGRYISILKGHFGVTSPDARQQRAEYIGGKRVPINMTTVTQTSSTNTTSPLGQTGAMSMTLDNSDMFTYSSTEHGYIIGLVCIRTDKSYQQGLAKDWSRKTRFDYYWPSLANLSNLPVYNKEIFLQGTSEDEEVFGYQEAWAEYRYRNNLITGEFRSDYELSLDSWHYGDKYESLPVLGKTWFEEGKSNIQRTLSVQNQDQFLADFYFDVTAVRPMPLYSVPGLIDHH